MRDFHISFSDEDAYDLIKDSIDILEKLSAKKKILIPNLN
tara:strand:+ start:236 stop:355 length:120 start_codon:yes stop_codon:yes gene_type:complete